MLGQLMFWLRLVGILLIRGLASNLAPIFPTRNWVFQRFSRGSTTDRSKSFSKKTERKSLGQEKIDGVMCNREELIAQGYRVVLNVDHAKKTPFQIDFYRSGKLQYSTRYEVYEPNLQFDEKLFQPPKVIMMAEPGK